MKIYNLGSDYAHQRSLRNKEKSASESKESPKPEISEDNAGNQIQSGGEGEVASVSETQENSKKDKRKKEAGTEKKQPKDSPEV